MSHTAASWTEGQTTVGDHLSPQAGISTCTETSISVTCTVTMNIVNIGKHSSYSEPSTPLTNSISVHML